MPAPEPQAAPPPTLTDVAEHRHLPDDSAMCSAEAGPLYWQEVRDIVNEARFRGANVELWESSGWLVRKFLVRGDRRDVEALRKRLAQWARE